MVRFRVLTLLCVDILLLILSYLLAAALLRDVGLLWEFDLGFYLSDEQGVQKIGLVVATVVLCLYFIGLYDVIRVKSRRILFQDLLLTFGVSFFSQALLSYGRSDLVLSRWIMMAGSASALVLLFAWRLSYSILLVRVVGRQKVLFVGNSPLARQMAQFIQDRPERGYETIGCLSTVEGERFPGQIIPMESDLAEQIRKLNPEVISVSRDLDINDELSRQLMECSMEGLAVQSIGVLHEQLFYRVALETITLEQLVYSPSLRPRPGVELIQDLYSRLGAAIGLLIAWPAMVMVAIAVRLDSRGPIIFRQTRISKNGVPFQFLKFRSMYVEEQMVAPERAKENDPRITRVGRWIRLSRLDEFPQFINVLRGEMALVGPRPEMPEFEEELLKVIPLYRQRHRVKPGITGWAQIHHEPEDSMANTARKLEYDLYYIKNMSPGLDFMIMFRTVKTILLRIGAR
jgi:exopolysaccharide biosynthesis polyprenyl glycosylphosphotransferase